MNTYSENPPDTPRNRGNYEAPHMSPVMPEEDARTILLNRVSWSAVFSGVFLSLAVQLVLNLLGVGIGAATLNPVEGTSPSASSLSIGALAWWIVSGIIAAFIGGFAAGRTSGEPRESSAAWHGLTSWAAALICLVAIITMGAGSIIGGTLNLAGLTGGSYAAANKNATGSALSGILPGAGGGTAAANNASNTTTNTVSSAYNIMNANPAEADQAREQAAQQLARTKGISIDDARAQVRNDEANVRQAADTTAKSVSRGSLLATFALILGAIAAWVGGRLGAVKPTVTSYRLRQEQLH